MPVAQKKGAVVAGAVANEYVDLINKINGAIRSEQNLRVALTTVMAIHKPRIFNQGQDSTGSKIGTYSTTPISISKKNQARNTGKTYFKGGYAEYHGAIGKGGSNVVLRNTDQMMIDYGIVFSGGKFGFGFQNGLNANKSGWMTDKYDKEIFQLSDSEVDVLGNVLVEQLNRAIQ